MVAAMEDESPDTHIFHGSDEKGLVTYDSCTDPLCQCDSSTLVGVSIHHP